MNMITCASRVSSYLGRVSFQLVLGVMVMFDTIPLLLLSVHILFLALTHIHRWLTNVISPRVLVPSNVTTWVSWPRVDDTMGIGN